MAMVLRSTSKRWIPPRLFPTKRPSLAGSYLIYPTSTGGVLFEFQCNGWDFSVEFNPDGSIEMYGVQIDGPEEMAPIPFERMNDEFIELFDARTGRQTQ